MLTTEMMTPMQRIARLTTAVHDWGEGDALRVAAGLAAVIKNVAAHDHIVSAATARMLVMTAKELDGDVIVATIQ